MNVLFIVDGSLSNPILFSQGIPHIQENSSKGVNYSVLSIENTNSVLPGTKTGDRYMDAVKELNGLAKVYTILFDLEKNVIQRKLRVFFWILLGTLKGIKVVKSDKINIVHARSNIPTLIALFIKLFTGAKVIYDNRGLVSDEIPPNRKMRIFLEKKLEEASFKYADAIVVVSRAFKEYLVSLNNKMKSYSSKIYVIENSFSPKRFKYSSELRDRQLNLHNLKGRFVVVYSGPAVRWQRFDLVLEVFKVFKKIKPESFLLIISYDTEMDIIVRKSGIMEQDYSIYNLSAMEVNNYLIMGDLGLIFRDERIRSKVCAPIKFGEYLASGLPILLMDKVGDSSDITRKFNVGVVFENEKDLFDRAIKEMIELTSQPDIKLRCRNAAEQDLSLSSSAQKYLSIYKELNEQ